jgi:hypothetical protein
MDWIEETSVISHLFMSDDLNLYIIVNGEKDYKVYERDLDTIMKVLGIT